MLNLLKRLV